MTNQPEYPQGPAPSSAPRDVEEVRLLVESWVDAHHAEIHRFLVRMVRDSALADDLLQETYLKAFRSCQELRDSDAVRPWLYRIAWTTCISHLRDRRRADLRAQELPDGYQDPSPGAESALLRDELRDRIQKALEVVPVRQRSAFILRTEHQMEYEDIARSLDCSPAAARSLVSQAIQRIRRRLRREGLDS